MWSVVYYVKEMVTIYNLCVLFVGDCVKLRLLHFIRYHVGVQKNTWESKVHGTNDETSRWIINGCYIGSSFNIKNHVSQPYKTTDKLIVLYFIIFSSFFNKWIDSRFDYKMEIIKFYNKFYFCQSPFWIAVHEEKGISLDLVKFYRSGKKLTAYPWMEEEKDHVFIWHCRSRHSNFATICVILRTL
jgi:hypothetical protein